MNSPISQARPADDSRERLQHLSAIAERLLERCKAAGASQAEVSCNEDTGLAVNVRMGEVETVEATRDRGIAVTVYFGQRKGSASTADQREASLDATVAQACAIAGFTEDDAAAGLADPALMATTQREFDGWHPWDIDAQRAIDLALACEQATATRGSPIPTAPRSTATPASASMPTPMASSAANAAPRTASGAR